MLAARQRLLQASHRMESVEKEVLLRSVMRLYLAQGGEGFAARLPPSLLPIAAKVPDGGGMEFSFDSTDIRNGAMHGAERCVLSSLAFH